MHTLLVVLRFAGPLLPPHRPHLADPTSAPLQSVPHTFAPPLYLLPLFLSISLSIVLTRIRGDVHPHSARILSVFAACENCALRFLRWFRRKVLILSARCRKQLVGALTSANGCAKGRENAFGND